MKLAVPDGVSRRIDRYSCQGSICQGLMRVPRGIARSNARLRHWSAIVAGVETRRPPSEVRRRGGLYLLRLARRRSMGEETV